jgi:hypothetical protein
VPDRSSSFVVPGTTVATVRTSLRKRHEPLWRIRVVGDDRVSVVLVGVGRAPSRPRWDGTMSDTADGVRFEGRVRDRVASMMAVILAVTTTAIATTALEAALVGDRAAIGLALVGAAVGALCWWHLSTADRLLTQHGQDTEQLLGRLLSDPRRPTPRP